MDVRKISIGPAKIFMGNTGETPTTYVGWGYDEGVTLEVSFQNAKEYFVGIPQVPMERIPASRVEVTLNFTDVEWDLEKFSNFLGAEYSAGLTQETLFLQDFSPNPVAFFIEHEKPDGNKIYMSIFKAILAKNFNFPFVFRTHRFPLSFRVLQPTVDFAGTSPNALAQITAPRITC